MTPTDADEVPRADRPGRADRDGRRRSCCVPTSTGRCDDGRHPVLLSYGPYGKGLHFPDGYPDAWRTMVEHHPDVAAGSSNRYQAWEVCDPEKWVPDGYVCVRVDARGWGRSPGYIEPYAARGTKDLHDCIEWAAAQPWSNGKVGLLGISYYAITQWLVAAHPAAHLTAMIPWEGVSDFYRDMFYHGGMLCQAVDTWYRRTITTVQHGLGERSFTNPETGELVTGPETLTDEELEANRSDYGADVRAHPLRRRLPPRAVRGLLAHHRSLPVGGQLGRGGPAPARQRRGRSCRRASSRSGSRSTGWSTGPSSTPTTGWVCRSGSSITSSRARTTDGTPASGDAARADGRRRVHRSDRGRVADRADRVDEAAPGPGRRGPAREPLTAGERGELLGVG